MQTVRLATTRLIVPRIAKPTDTRTDTGFCNSSLLERFRIVSVLPTIRPECRFRFLRGRSRRLLVSTFNRTDRRVMRMLLANKCPNSLTSSQFGCQSFDHTTQKARRDVLFFLPSCTENLRLDRPLLLSRLSRFAPMNANPTRP